MAVTVISSWGMKCCAAAYCRLCVTVFAAKLDVTED